jgi:hypothetical protein
MVKDLTKIVTEKPLVCEINCWRFLTRKKTRICYVQTSEGTVIEPYKLCAHGYHVDQIDVGEPRLAQSSAK